MAKIKFGALVTDMRGKSNGHVLSKNRSGAYMRTKVTPTNPRSSAQIESRNRLATESQAWAGLTASQRAAWNSAVNQWQKTDIFGDLKTPSGFNLFQRLNNVLIMCGQSQIDTPPVPGTVEAFTSLSVTAASGTPAVSLTFAGAISSGEVVIIRATNGISAGRSFVKSQFRNIAILTNSDTSPKNLLSAYTAKFGSVPAIGMKLFIETIHVNKTTGQKGVPQQCSVVIAA